MQNFSEGDQERWLSWAAERSYERLHGAYKRYFDASITFEHFCKGFVQPIMSEGLTGDEMCAELFPQPRVSEVGHVDEKMVIVALAYTAEAMRFRDAGEFLEAWNCLLEASRWFGSVIGTGSLDEVADATDKKIRTEAGQVGQQGRQAVIDLTKQKAIAIERRLRPKTGRWPSRAVAARVVWKTLKKELVAGDHEPKNAEAAEKWLVSRCFRDHPEKEKIFKPIAVRN